MCSHVQLVIALSPSIAAGAPSTRALLSTSTPPLFNAISLPLTFPRSAMARDGPSRTARHSWQIVTPPDHGPVLLYAMVRNLVGITISCSRLQCILPNLLGWLFYVRTRGTEVGVGCSRRDVVYSYGRNSYRLLSASHSSRTSNHNLSYRTNRT